MGLIDWLFGSKPPARVRPPRPQNVTPLGETQVMFLEGSMMTVMDRDTFDYTYGESDAPDPAQGDLEYLMAGVTRVRALACGMCGGKPLSDEVLLDTSDPAAIFDLRRALSIVEDPDTFTHCHCLGGPTLEIFRGGERAAVIGLQHGHSIRWSKWKHDARLRDGGLLNDWLLGWGVDGRFLDRLFHNQYDMGGLAGDMGLRRPGPAPLTRSEQRLRLAEASRAGNGSLDFALNECNAVLAAEPELAFGYAVRSQVRRAKGDFAGCAADCTEAIRLGFADPAVYLTRAVARDHLEQFADAEADCGIVLAADPKDANALNTRGLIRRRSGAKAKALDDFAAAIRLAPDWHVSYLNRGQAHIEMNNPDGAAADYGRVIDLLAGAAPGDREAAMHRFIAHNNRAHAFRMKGDHARAAEDMAAAERIRENQAAGAGGRQ